MSRSDRDGPSRSDSLAGWPGHRAASRVPGRDRAGRLAGPDSDAGGQTRRRRRGHSGSGCQWPLAASGTAADRLSRTVRVRRTESESATAASESESRDSLARLESESRAETVTAGDRAAEARAGGPARRG
jgi:hypothetical protein